MRDKKDNATIDLPGFEPALAVEAVVAEPRAPVARPRRATLKQEQMPLLDLEQTDASGLPVWKNDPDLDLSGLPMWKPVA